MLIRALGIIIGGLFGFGLHASPFFSIKVPICQEAASAQEAKQAAIHQGIPAAWSKLMSYMVLRQNLAKIKMPTHLDDYILDYRFENEKASWTRYEATFVVTFDDKMVQDFLYAQGIPFSTTSPPALLIVPLSHEGKLGEEELWFQAWQKSMPIKNVLSLDLPLGDLEDQVVFAKDPLFSGLHDLKERYAREAVLVIHEPEAKEGKYVVRVEPFFLENKDMQNQQIIIENLITDSKETLYEALVPLIQEQIAEQWKCLHQQGTLKNNTAPQTISVPVESVKDIYRKWGALKKTGPTEMQSFSRTHMVMRGP